MDYGKEFKNYAIKDQGINSMYYDKIMSTMYPSAMTPNIIEERQLNAIALGGAQGQASDIEITAREILKLKDELYQIISKHSGQSFDKVSDDSDRDYWMKADEALKYGMIDEILVRDSK